MIKGDKRIPTSRRHILRLSGLPIFFLVAAALVGGGCTSQRPTRAAHTDSDTLKPAAKRIYTTGSESSNDCRRKPNVEGMLRTLCY
ncbi:hypothetical protein RGCCGE502_21665 [Rhizobium grahamii CCGE 502]|uniref:Lipoprotein n=1 Tax=Rhizobium grahamii CCGE 502 TaxID=990285 RepID=S3HC87_9HYPH|nr:hypothetical protein RGCCGE502_21665 [Rhizobium grahamii CCGE 502]